MTRQDTVTLSDGCSGEEGAASALVKAVLLDHHFYHHCALFGKVHHRAPSFRMAADLHRCTAVNYRGLAADA